MLLKKIGVKNYVIVLLVLLGVTTLLVISAFILTALFPHSVGQRPDSYEIETICDFEPWSYEIGELKVFFPQGGTIVTVSTTDRKRTVILLGNGSYEQNGTGFDQEVAAGIFMTIDHVLFDEIRGNNIFIPVENQAEIARVTNLFNKQNGIPVIWESVVPLTFHTQDGLSFYYFILPAGDPLLPLPFGYNLSTVFGSFLIYLLFIMIMMMIITIFSPDHRYSRYWIHLRKTDPGSFSLAIIPLIAVVLTISKIIPGQRGWHDFYAAIGYAAVIFLLIIFAKRGKIDYLDYGLRRDSIMHGYLLAIITATLIIWVVGGLPAGLKPGILVSLLYLPAIFLLIGLPLEMIWRGYIQVFLSRRFGPNKGIMAMVVLVAITHYLTLIAADPWMAAYPYTYLEAVVLVPGTAAILGYIYLRTENILCCALLHSLLLWLPGIILY